MEPAITVTAKCELRAVIRFLQAKKLEPIQIHRELSEVYGEKCISVQHVRKWCREFSAGRTDTHDEQRSGRPSISDDVVVKIERVLREDRRITLADLVLRVPEVSEASVERIVTKKLGYRKLCARWVPHMLTEDHKQQRVECAQEFLQQCAANKEDFLDSIVTGDETWCHHFTPETKEQSRQWRHPTSPQTKKFKKTMSAGKVMATVFWDRHGVLLVDFMEKGTTINAERYCQTLEKLRRAIQNRRRGRLSKGIRLHHDNARVHTARRTQDLLMKYRWTVIPHAPYSPDIAPSDFHLFPKLKNHLGGQRFSDDDEVKEAVTKYLSGLAVDFYADGYEKWIIRQQKCIEKNGDYVEK